MNKFANGVERSEGEPFVDLFNANLAFTAATGSANRVRVIEGDIRNSSFLKTALSNDRGQPITFDLIFMDFARDAAETEVVWEQLMEGHVERSRTVIVMDLLADKLLPFFISHVQEFVPIALPGSRAIAFIVR